MTSYTTYFSDLRNIKTDCKIAIPESQKIKNNDFITLNINGIGQILAYSLEFFDPKKDH